MLNVSFLVVLPGKVALISYDNLCTSIYQRTLNIVHPCNLILWLSILNGFAGNIFYINYTTLSTAFERVRASADIIFCSCQNWRKWMFNSGEPQIFRIFRRKVYFSFVSDLHYYYLTTFTL